LFIVDGSEKNKITTFIGEHLLIDSFNRFLSSKSSLPQI
jgi:hypothetical protein